MVPGSFVEVRHERMEVVQGHGRGVGVVDEIHLTSPGSLEDSKDLVAPRGPSILVVFS
jgi:hypothetical protein